MKPLAAVGRALCALPLLAALVACGGPAPELGLNGPSSAALLWGATQTLELAIERNDTATGDLTFTVDGLPEGVTARFEPATIAGDALSATLHLEAASDAAAATALVTIRATGEDALVAEHILLLEVSGLTVSGVVEPLLGPRIGSGIAVKVGAHWVATDHEGRFVAHNVSVPYDLVLQGLALTEVYQGLTTPTPRVTGFINEHSVIDTRTDTLAVTISPTPQLHESITLCSSVPFVTTESCRTVAGNGVLHTLAMDVEFYRTATGPHHLVARREQFDAVTGQSLGFTGHGSVAIPHAPVETTPLNLNLAPSTSTEIPYALEVPAGSEVQERIGHVTYGERLNGRHDVDPDVFFLPEGASGVLGAVLLDPETNTQFATLQPITGPLDGPITFALAPQDISPADGATVTSSTEFRAVAPEGGLVTHMFTRSGAAPTILMVHTFGDSVRLSELEPKLGPLHVSDFAQWVIVSMPQVTTPEQAIEQSVGFFSYAQAAGGLPLRELPAGPSRISMNTRALNAAAGSGARLPGFEDLETLLQR